MMYHRFLAPVLVLTLFFFSQVLFGAQVIKITTGYWPPYLAEKMPNQGFMAQIIREAFAAENIEVDYTFLPWSRALAMVKSTDYQASAVWSCTKKRSREFLYSDPILPYHYVFYHRKSEAFDWASFSDLEGMNVGLTQDYSYSNTLAAAIESGLVDADTTTSDVANFKKLLIGRIDLFPMDPVVGEAIIKRQFAVHASSLTFHPKPLRRAFYHLLFEKDSPDANRLKRAFDKGLQTLRKNGRFQQIVEQALAANSSSVAVEVLMQKLINWEATSNPCSPATDDTSSHGEN